NALAAMGSGIRFYVALPSPTLDVNLVSGETIPIEARESDEVLSVNGADEYGHTARVSISPAGTLAVNYAFDVTPARLVTGLITERGITSPSAEALAMMFPDRIR